MPSSQIVCSDYLDFLRTLESNSVDLVLTDPPYGISRRTGFAEVKTGVERFAVSMDFGEWDHEEIDLESLCKEIYRILKPSGTAIIWYDLWKLSEVHVALQSSGHVMLRLIVWHKTNPVPLNSKRLYLTNSREIAVLGVKKGSPVFHSEYDTGDYFSPIPRHQGNRIHPTQKPVDLFGELIQKHTDPQGLVVDPFLGSGTTAVAALASGRSFAGCDIDANYVEAARKRISTISVQQAMSL